jgi:hypothetical protein
MRARPKRCRLEGYDVSWVSVSHAMKGGGDGRGIGDRRGDVRRFVAEDASLAFCDRDDERGQRNRAAPSWASAERRNRTWPGSQVSF